jgi:predicted esterase
MARLACLLGLVATTRPVPALTLADVVPRGQVVERLTSRANPKATYAAYLPSGYSAERKWPVVFLLDPRGRALIPLELFRPTAERLGYVLLSSYDSQSDGSRAPNDMALDAMLTDAERYLAMDGRRLYFAGFSGTARYAWDVSEQYPGALAGILGFGAGLPGDRSWYAAHVRGAPFAFYGAVGTDDPNYEEVRQLERDLGATALRHTVAYFAGPHQWPPQTLCARALEWMELDAQRRSLTPPVRAWVDSLGAARLHEAAAFDSAGGKLAALHAYRDWVRDFGGWLDTASASSRARALAKDGEVTRLLAREEQLAQQDLEWTRALFGWLRDLKMNGEPRALNDARSRTTVDDSRQQAARTVDSLGAAAARRATGRILVYTTFYELRDYLATKRWEEAAAILRLAEYVSPKEGGVCFGLARVYAQLGKEKDALDHLQCAMESGVITADLVTAAPLLEPLRQNARYRELLERWPRKG